MLLTPKIRFAYAFFVASLAIFAQRAVAQEVVDVEAAKAKIAASIKTLTKSYVAAFNAQDFEKMAEHWTDRGVHTNQATGSIIVGRDALKSEFKKLFSESKNLQLEIISEEIEFVSPSVAIEHGVASVAQSGTEQIEKTEYSCVFILQSGQWKIDRIDDNLVLDQSSHAAHLQPLDWLIGNWVHESETSTIEFECKWTQENNHISRVYRIIEGDQVVESGFQIIGWDPVNQSVRSWLFDSRGGYVEGRWEFDNNRWVVSNDGTLPNGSKGKALHIITPVDADQFKFRKTEQVVDGSPLDDTEEITVRRLK